MAYNDPTNVTAGLIESVSGKTTTSTFDWGDFIGDIINIIPGTIAAVKGTKITTPATTTTGTTGTGTGVVTGSVTIDSILSQLGIKPTISGVSVSIPSWVYWIVIAIGLMVLIPFLKSFKRRRRE